MKYLKVIGLPARRQQRKKSLGSRKSILGLQDKSRSNSSRVITVRRRGGKQETVLNVNFLEGNGLCSTFLCKTTELSSFWFQTEVNE